MNKRYRSPYEAYPFLSDASEDLRCDFEIMTDRLASMTGLLASLCDEEELKEELLKIDEMIYHLNPSLRTFFSIEQEEIEFLVKRIGELEASNAHLYDKFVLPAGSQRGSLAHVLRADSKAIVRLLYRFEEKANKVEPSIFDFANLLSGYFFQLAMKFNTIDGVGEIPYKSRNYK
ncbi:MAG: ATP--cob(I)alamin adenosyltransferase [Tissierellia bacterium]|nr:ATP--cob(I)alamin adenosyltransferase [Tissierellia bacterium]